MCLTLWKARRTVLASLITLFVVSIHLPAQTSKPAANGSILGDTVLIQVRYPNMSTPYVLMSQGVVTNDGVILNDFNNDVIGVYPNSVDLKDLSPTGATFEGAAFNGFSITDLTNPDAFTGVSMSVKTNIPGFGTANISEVGGVLFLNYQSLSTPQGSFSRVRFFNLADSSSEPEALEDNK